MIMSIINEINVYNTEADIINQCLKLKVNVSEHFTKL